jgi:acetyl-CoA carboxylase biotin carboxylase subunit
VKRVLIANRGEIALRIIRACHEEGLEAVAVYSEVDRLSPHVRAANASVSLGPAPARESYLNIPKLLAAAKDTGADAIHPGYGFLAERADFAEAVEDAGLVFVGPPASAIRAMGEKTAARRRMREAGVPIVPGTTEPVPDAAGAVRAAEELGYPVLLKAAAGGGGKGMRVARDADEVRRGFTQATSEALSAFGDGAVYVERFVGRPRHVEIQVLADRGGRTVHLGERECSVQRRHQKLIEETPSPAVDTQLRQAMGDAAVRAAQAVGYVGAGTVEFLLDPSGRFYFLEMNTRIQVEHPITEMVYGVDLVREQLRIAGGEALRLPAALQPRGHAIECRITSEDPAAGFLPVTGRIRFLRVPTGPAIRWDGGVESGSEVTRFYDSLLGKLVVWAEDRPAAIRRTQRALEELVILGLPTSQPFHRLVMAEPGFVSGQYDIEYVERIGNALLTTGEDEATLRLVAVAAALAYDEARETAGVTGLAARSDALITPWIQAARLEGMR